MGRILIADDHDALRRGLVRALIDAGHDVDEAPNGNAAIQRLHDGYYDVVLTDLKMGGSDARDLMHNANLRNCVAFDNRVKGFDQNNNRGSMTLTNCTGYRNGTYNFAINDTVAVSSGKLVTVINCVAYEAGRRRADRARDGGGERVHGEGLLEEVAGAHPADLARGARAAVDARDRARLSVPDPGPLQVQRERRGALRVQRRCGPAREVDVDIIVERGGTQRGISSPDMPGQVNRST